MLLQLHPWHQNPHGALATDAAARALSSALPIWEEEIFKGKKKKEKRTAFFISLTAHYHGNSPGLAWLAGPPLPITGGNNTIRRERGGEMRVQYCIQSIILQLTVFSCRLGRSVLGGSNNSLMSDVTEKYESAASHRSSHGSVRFLIAAGECVFYEFCVFLQMFYCTVATLKRASCIFRNECLKTMLDISDPGSTQPAWSF